MSNEIIRSETAVSIFGVDARAFNVVANTETGRILHQTIGATRYYTEGKTKYRISVELRFDDQCKNGHETFAITGSIDEFSRGRYREYAGGCVHDELARHFPELAHLIKWHLVSTDGPMHYIANTCYHASDRDYNDLQKGEKRQLKDRKTGVPAWELVAITGDKEIQIHELKRYTHGETAPTAPRLEYRPWCIVGEGKAREFDHARSSAVWPEATDEQLSLPRAELESLLIARLPALMADFKRDMLAAGFIYPGND